MTWHEWVAWALVAAAGAALAVRIVRFFRRRSDPCGGCPKDCPLRDLRRRDGRDCRNDQ